MRWLWVLRLRYPFHLGFVLAVMWSSAVSLLAPGADASPINYEFVKIAETDGSIVNLGGAPSLNELGIVSFKATFDTGLQAILSGSGGALATVADTSGPFSALDGSTSINDAGIVAFRAIFGAGGQGIFTGDGVGLTTIADTSGPLSSVFSPSMNQSGSVAFVGNLDAGGQAIFAGNGGGLTKIYDTTGVFDGFTGVVELADNSLIAFKAQIEGPSDGIFVGDGASPTTIATTFNSTFQILGDTPSVNSLGTVIFAGVEAGLLPGVYVAVGNPPVPLLLIEESGAFSALRNPAISEDGRIFFEAHLITGERGIFTGPDPINDRVIGSGDALFGSVVDGVTFFRGINTRGMFAFFAELEDGRRLIVRADPIRSVPEPGLAMLLVFVLIGAVVARMYYGSNSYVRLCALAVGPTAHSG